MKNTIKVLGIIVLVAVIGFSMAACDDGNGTGGGGVADERAVYESAKDGTSYKLEITKNTGKATYVPANGDYYTLTITKAGESTKTSTGTITVSGITFTLTHNTGSLFIITIDNMTITSINSPNGTIPIDGGGTVQAPGTISQQGNNPGGGNPGGNTSGNENGFSWQSNNDGVTITGYTGPGGNVIIPATIEGKQVTSIGEFAFNGCTSLISVIIPNGVTIINRWAFRGCSSLAGVTIPDGVTYIGEYAFAFCNLTSVTIPSSVSIWEYAFFGCTSLTSVTIPASVTTIGNGAFGGCTSLAGVTIPASVTTIGNGAFYGCTSLAGVTIPNSVTYIGDVAFNGCTSLTSAIPNSVTYIGVGAFNGCTSLTSVTIPNSVTRIGDGAFNGCTGLTSVTFQGTIPVRGFGSSSSTFLGDLYHKFYETDKYNGTPGTYTTTVPVNEYSVWTKQ
jgi:hypothetical protein